MALNLKFNSPETSDEKKIRSINFWHFVLVLFIVLWMGGAYIYLDKKTEIANRLPLVLIGDAASGVNMTNFFQVNPTNSSLFPTNYIFKQPFRMKTEHRFGDVVVVKFFYVEAVVLEKSSPTSDYYDIVYKDHNHVLQKISLPAEMLMVPVDGMLNPVSLLVD